ncbi:MAG: hypothetical protein HY394_05740 [Candidatus Diapherotrites archaeon]|nr:hypothetical protein [Candidatus Diapherotrites archaeon]
MKQKIWINKSNGQLCVTVPKDSGMRDGMFVDIRQAKIEKVVYTSVVADLFHYGILNLLKTAQAMGDMHVCGVQTDGAAEQYRGKPVTSLKERLAVIQSLNCVDRAVVQKSPDPTENLQKLHDEFPGAEIILVYGSNWKQVPGKDFVESIRGKVVQPEFYDKLSEPKIYSSLAEKYRQAYGDFSDFTERFRVKNVVYFDDKDDKSGHIISTKADTLRALQPALRHSRIEKTFVFTEQEWERSPGQVVREIAKEFSEGRIVVRSSAVNEDSLHRSAAGHYHSELNVNPKNVKQTEAAIEKVVKSYSEKGDKNPENQVLVQSQAKNVKMSGVIFTREIGSNAPYYTINFDDTTDSTDRVTKGEETKAVRISRFLPARDFPQKWYKLLTAVQEIESVIPEIPLDIEFAVDSDENVIIFQARPLAANATLGTKKDKIVEDAIASGKAGVAMLLKPQPHLCGKTDVLSDMSDWNPAELLGDRTKPLDYSLFRLLISDGVWHKARESLGYWKFPEDEDLCHCIANKPFVSARNSFNSFCPESLAKGVKEKLCQFSLHKLSRQPELHDKVEFEVYYTCHDLGFAKRSAELLEEGFSQAEVGRLKESLAELTNAIVANHEKTISDDMADAEKMGKKREAVLARAAKEKDAFRLIGLAGELLADCRELGTLQFSRLARMAFIAKANLKALAAEKLMSQEQYNDFLNSIETVATELNRDFVSLLEGKTPKDEFLKKYGHLRPGTFDITATRYDKNPSLISDAGNAAKNAFAAEKKKFSIDEKALRKISERLEADCLKFSAETLFAFARKSIEAREKSKFEFTKNLSAGLELVAEAGEKLGFTRKEMSYLEIAEITVKAKETAAEKTKSDWKKKIADRQFEEEAFSLLSLPPLLFSPLDIEIVPSYVARPNYITGKRIAAELFHLYKFGRDSVFDLSGKIVALENADPGYDWIFTKNPAGLVTKYGGVSSHMSIRCAEFGIPAAIGCGELLFEKIRKAERISLDCRAKSVSF